MSSHKDALILSNSLEARSDKNLIFHYRSEIGWIGQGQRATDLLPEKVLQNLARLGILEYLKGPRGYILTNKGRIAIQETSK